MEEEKETTSYPEVEVLDPYTGKKVKLKPLKVWSLKKKNGKGVLMGQFISPATGAPFKAKVPEEYLENIKE
ncbi:MAG: chromatin protein Cren7 [Desulfurococcales archaeon]|nr:chromatin protein Cren7 [Desulfurococcales archaeon]